MRVVFLQRSANFSGGNRVIAQYAAALQNNGHEVLVVSAREPRPMRLRRALNSLRNVVHLPSDGTSWLDDLDIEHRRVSSEIRPGDVPDADAVVATWWETAEWAARLPESCGAAAYFLQGVEWTIDGAPLSRVRQTWRLPLHKIVIAEFMRDIAAREFGDSDVSFVPNSVDPKLYFPPGGDVTRDGLLFLYGGTTRGKGWDIALAALHAIHVANPKAAIRGFGRRTPELPPWVEYFESPPQEQIRKLYQEAQLYLHCSRAEGFGLPLLEAMACGTPVVGTEAGAAPELVEAGGGEVVPFVDSECSLDIALSTPTTAISPRLAEAAVRVLGDTQDRFETRSSRALEIAKKHSPKLASERFEAALVRAIEKKKLSIYLPANAELGRHTTAAQLRFEPTESPVLFWGAWRSAGQLRHPDVVTEVEALIAASGYWSKLRRAAGAGIHKRFLRSSVASSSGRGPRLLLGPSVAVTKHPTTLLLRTKAPPLIRRFTLFFAESSSVNLELWSGSLEVKEKLSLSPSKGVLVPAHPNLLVSCPSPDRLVFLDFFEADLEAEQPSFETRRKLPHPDAPIAEQARVVASIAKEEGERALSRLRDYVRNRFFGFE